MPGRFEHWTEVVIAAWIAISTAIQSWLAYHTKNTYVRKSEIYGRDKRPMYQYREDCVTLQRNCITRNCAEFESTKAAIKENSDSLHSLHVTVGKMDQKLDDLIKAYNKNGKV